MKDARKCIIQVIGTVFKFLKFQNYVKKNRRLMWKRVDASLLVSFVKRHGGNRKKGKTV